MQILQHAVVKYIMVFIAGGVLPLAYAPFGLSALPVVSLALLWFIAHRATARQGFKLGWYFGLGFFGFGVSWLQISIHQFGIPSLWFSVPVTVVFIMFLALYPAIMLSLSVRFGAFLSPLKALLILPGIWVLHEWLRGWLFTGFPWLNLGYSQSDSPMAGFAPLVGVYGVSYLLALFACLVYLVTQVRGRQRYWMLLPILLIWIAAMFLRGYDWTVQAPRTLKVALVQGAVPQERKWLREELEPTKKLYLDLTEPVWGHDLIIWPETAIPAFHSQISDFLLALDSRAKDSGSDISLGLAYRKPGETDYYNSIVNFGAQPGVYKKRHLVPFGEYLPLEGLLRPFLTALKIPMSQFSSGDPDSSVLQVAGLPVGFSICYEDAFGEEVIQALPQAALLVNISNDAWFGDSLAPHQHLQMARLRALEGGRYLLRATNTGISAVIDPKGVVVAKSPAFVPTTLSAVVYPVYGATPYVMVGNWLIVTLSLSLLLLGRRLSQ